MTSAQERLYMLAQARALTRSASELLRLANYNVPFGEGAVETSQLVVKSMRAVDEAFAALGKLLPP